MKIAVFGANGFLGARLVERLGRDGHELKVFDRSFDLQRTATWSPQTRCIKGEFTVETDFTEILDGCEVGDNSIVASGAVVNGVFPSNSLIGGVPAKLIKQI